MNVGAYKGASALAAYEKWQEIISENLAASSVPGYKKSEVTFAGMVSDHLRLNGQRGGSGDVSGSMPEATARLNFSQGELHQTGSELDFAIQGPGFFQIQRENGETAYTRDGEFHVSADRTLVNKQGLPVLGESGPLTFQQGVGGPVTINAEGVIFQRDEQIGKLPVYDFTDPQKLRRAGAGLLMPVDATAVPERVEKPEVLNGYLEGSNVSPLTEMVNLIAVARAYESSQKLVQGNDDRSQKAIEILGSPTA
jgi:flagellar basal-body rod protein FlgF